MWAQECEWMYVLICLNAPVDDFAGSDCHIFLALPVLFSAQLSLFNCMKTLRCTTWRTALHRTTSHHFTHSHCLHALTNTHTPIPPPPSLSRKNRRNIKSFSHLTSLTRHGTVMLNCNEVKENKQTKICFLNTFLQKHSLFIHIFLLFFFFFIMNNYVHKGTIILLLFSY